LLVGFLFPALVPLIVSWNVNYLKTNIYFIFEMFFKEKKCYIDVIRERIIEKM